jgi:hypothetical protein
MLRGDSRAAVRILAAAAILAAGIPAAGRTSVAMGAAGILAVAATAMVGAAGIIGDRISTLSPRTAEERGMGAGP